jgi:hypothetical protein
VSPFILLTGAIINCDVTGWLCCTLLDWYNLLLPRSLHASCLTIGLHVVKVHMCGVDGMCGQ